MNEIFGPTIQGEGKSAGQDVVFLRLAMCNLHCIWCDTPHTWNWEGTKFAHPEKFDQEKEVHLEDAQSIVEVLENLALDTIRTVIVSGGEPLLQQKALVPLFEELWEKQWWIEVETNGTVTPSADMLMLVDQFNVSPKLSNSEDPFKLRWKKKALAVLAKSWKTNFKFVVESPKDIPEIL